MKVTAYFSLMYHFLRYLGNMYEVMNRVNTLLSIDLSFDVILPEEKIRYYFLKMRIWSMVETSFSTLI